MAFNPAVSDCTGAARRPRQPAKHGLRAPPALAGTGCAFAEARQGPRQAAPSFRSVGERQTDERPRVFCGIRPFRIRPLLGVGTPGSPASTTRDRQPCCRPQLRQNCTLWPSAPPLCSGAGGPKANFELEYSDRYYLPSGKGTRTNTTPYGTEASAAG